jgi:hypothetical protein
LSADVIARATHIEANGLRNVGDFVARVKRHRTSAQLGECAANPPPPKSASAIRAAIQSAKYSHPPREAAKFQPFGQCAVSAPAATGSSTTATCGEQFRLRAELQGSVGRNTWVAGSAVQRDAYRPRDVPRFAYTYPVPLCSYRTISMLRPGLASMARRRLSQPRLLIPAPALSDER